MAIDAYVGLPGHGKSYGVVEHVIIPSLKQGRHVVTNIPLNVDALLMDFGGTIQQLPDDWFELEDLTEYAVNGCVLVLDELWRRWPAGMLTNQASIGDKSLLAEHRHKVDKENRSMRIVLVTQDLSQIASWVRVLVETTYRIAKKSKKFYVVSIYAGAITGNKAPKTALIRQASGRFKKEVFVYYSSATQSETGNVGDESTADNRASILKSWGLWALIGIVILGAFIGISGLIKFFSSPQLVSEPAAQSVSPVAELLRDEQERKPVSRATQAVFKEVLPTSSEPPLSTLWRVGGYVKGDGLERVALLSAGRVRYVPISDCAFYESGIDVFCDVEGERVTPWSGSGAVTTVFESAPVRSSQQQSAPVFSERSQIETGAL